MGRSFPWLLVAAWIECLHAPSPPAINSRAEALDRRCHVSDAARSALHHRVAPPAAAAGRGRSRLRSHRRRQRLARASRHRRRGSGWRPPGAPRAGGAGGCLGVSGFLHQSGRPGARDGGRGGSHAGTLNPCPRARPRQAETNSSSPERLQSSVHSPNGRAPNRSEMMAGGPWPRQPPNDLDGADGGSSRTSVCAPCAAGWSSARSRARDSFDGFPVKAVSGAKPGIRIDPGTAGTKFDEDRELGVRRGAPPGVIRCSGNVAWDEDRAMLRSLGTSVRAAPARRRKELTDEHNRSVAGRD